jgi:hypothetical protein
VEPRYLNILENRTLPNGSLSFIEFESLPFVPQRVYWLSDVGLDQTRGSHAHKKLRQFIFAIQGSCDINLFNGFKSFNFTLAKGEAGVLINPGWWRTLTNFVPGTIIQVFADLPFDESDYIRDFDSFIALAKNNG